MLKQRRRGLPSVPITPQFVTFNGGADVVSPPLTIPPGMVREDQNFEQDINGGYRRILGYERYSGKARPSDAAYAILTVTLTGTVNVGDILTDNATTSFGTVIALGAANAYVALTQMTGHFSAGNVKVGGVVVGTCTAQEVTDGASTPLLHAQYKNLAADVYRALIAAVPGSGNILGVWLFNDVVYAFRNNAGGTAAAMYASSASGWQLVALGRELKYTTGSATIAEGTTITGATSGATAVLKRLTLETGTYGASTAAGRFIFASVTGAFTNGENLQVAGVTKAVANGADTAITFAVPSGRFEFVNHNFGGAVNTKRVYGCDGKNRAFEFDGTVFVPIATGMTTDAPSHIHAHKNLLFLSFVGSVQFSAVGSPYVWNVVVGAGEIAMGDTVTGFMTMPSGTGQAALAIFTRNDIAILYGSSSSDFLLNPFDGNAGGYAYSIQYAMLALTLDDRGLSTLRTTQAYGNFASATLSKRVQSWLSERRTTVTASCIARDKNQYRIFFSDGSALYVTLDNDKVVGMMRQLLTNPVQCIFSEEMNDGSEVSYFGSTDGFIYQMEKGTSFDGGNIEYFLTTAYNHSGSPRQEKSYRHVTFEVSGDGYFEFSFSYQLGYASTDYEQPDTQTVSNNLSSALWDTFTWDAFYWDGANLLPAEADLEGTANNISLRIYGNSDYMNNARISGAFLQYTPRATLH